MSVLLRIARALGSAFERAHLLWAQREIHPMHPDVPYILNRLSELEDRR